MGQLSSAPPPNWGLSLVPHLEVPGVSELGEKGTGIKQTDNQPTTHRYRQQYGATEGKRGWGRYKRVRGNKW